MKENSKSKYANIIKEDLKSQLQKFSSNEIKDLLAKFDLEPQSELRYSNIYQLLEYVSWEELSKEINPTKEPVIEHKGKTYSYSFFQTVEFEEKTEQTPKQKSKIKESMQEYEEKKKILKEDMEIWGKSKSFKEYWFSKLLYGRFKKK